MDRFYAPRSRGLAVVELIDEEAHHLGRVLRKRPGDVVGVFDGDGAAATGEVLDVDRRRARITITHGWTVDPKAGAEFVLATAMPKGDRLRFLVEKATELGVARLIPLHTERSVVAPRESKIERLRMTVVSACKQSSRNRLMRIDEPIEWNRFLATRSSRLHVADPDGTAITDDGVGGVSCVAIGPEGGFTEDERSAAQRAGAVFVSLGPHVLRIETAAIAAAAIAASRLA